jgi:serine/threonine-protein kinase RIO1
MERYPDFDDFYDVWNGVLGQHVRNSEWNRLVFVREYRSIDHGDKDKYHANPSTSILTLDIDTFQTFYERASERVEALRRIDALRDEIREDMVNNRNVRRRLA